MFTGFADNLFNELLLDLDSSTVLGRGCVATRYVAVIGFGRSFWAAAWRDASGVDLIEACLALGYRS